VKLYIWRPNIFAYANTEEEAKSLVLQDLMTTYGYPEKLANECLRVHLLNRKLEIYEESIGQCINL
jgi:hypothetical protein